MGRLRGLLELVGLAADVDQLSSSRNDIWSSLVRLLVRALHALVALLMTAILAWFSSLDPAYVFLIVAIALAVLAVGAASARRMWSGGPSPAASPVQSPLGLPEVEQQLRGWLMDVMGYSARKVVDSNPKVLCHYDVTHPSNTHISVAVRADVPLIEIQASLVLGADNKKKLLALDAASARKLKREVVVGLAVIDVGVKVLGIPLERIEITKFVSNNQQLTQLTPIRR